jgi:cysteine desulfurase/selenocysteine lyase
MRRRCQLNHAGASPSPPSVMQRVRQHMELEQEVGAYAAAAMVERQIHQVYQSVADLIHAADPSEIALMESATVAWTRAFYSMAQTQKEEHSKANVILVSDAEYAANVVAACQWARDHHHWTVLSIPSSVSSDDEDNGVSTGKVDLQVLDDMLLGNYSYKDKEGKSLTLDPSRIALACITQVPTNSGIVNPVEEIGERISAYNSSKKQGHGRLPQILYLVDACQSVGQLAVDAQKIQCHALVATGRKYLRGPRGTGFLYVSSSILIHLMPNHIDHYGVPITRVPASYEDGDIVQNVLEFAPREDAKRFEFWESSLANRLGLGEAVRYAIDVGTSKIEEDCGRLAKLLIAQLGQVQHIVVHHHSSTTCGIVTFYSTTVDSKTIKEKMLTEGFELSVVPATSTPLDSAKLKVPDLVRASVSYTNTEDEINAFSQSLASLLGSSLAANATK